MLQESIRIQYFIDAVRMDSYHHRDVKCHHTEGVNIYVEE